MLQHGALVNEQRADGNASLHLALMRGTVYGRVPLTDEQQTFERRRSGLMIIDLIAFGADATRLNRNKETPIDLARRLGRHNMARLLEQAHYDFECAQEYAEAP